MTAAVLRSRMRFGCSGLVRDGSVGDGPILFLLLVLVTHRTYRGATGARKPSTTTAPKKHATTSSSSRRDAMALLPLLRCERGDGSACFRMRWIDRLNEDPSASGFEMAGGAVWACVRLRLARSLHLGFQYAPRHTIMGTALAHRRWWPVVIDLLGRAVPSNGSKRRALAQTRTDLLTADLAFAAGPLCCVRAGGFGQKPLGQGQTNPRAGFPPRFVCYKTCEWIRPTPLGVR